MSFVRQTSGADGAHPVTLIGVVHDHPASIHRVEALIEHLQAPILALELSPLLVPVFETRAESATTGPGREFQAAIAASESPRVVGIDGPTLGFLATLISTIHIDDHTVRTGLTTLREVCRATVQGVSYRLGRECDATEVTHDVSLADTPARQASDERQQVKTATAISNAFDPSAAVACRDETRERYMARRLERLRTSGPVVAIVGHDHLDPIAEHLS
ncbi:MAG: hypothetical protein U5K37_03545 [Natrialbaceae archaeon]|nr:hypothetical protein [Natrialbaceae archaeon]